MLVTFNRWLWDVHFLFFFLVWSFQFQIICEPQNLQDFFPMFCFTSKKHLLCCWKPKVSHDFPGAIEKLQWSIALETWLCGNLVLMLVSPSDIWMFPKIVVFFHPNHPMFNGGFPLFSPSSLGFPLIFGNTHILFLEHCDVDFVLLKWYKMEAKKTNKMLFILPNMGHSKLSGLIKMS